MLKVWRRMLPYQTSAQVKWRFAFNESNENLTAQASLHLKNVFYRTQIVWPENCTAFIRDFSELTLV